MRKKKPCTELRQRLSGRKKLQNSEAKSNLANFRITSRSGMTKQLENHEMRLENTQASKMAQRVQVLATTKSEDPSVLQESCSLTLTYAQEH